MKALEVYAAMQKGSTLCMEHSSGGSLLVRAQAPNR